MDNIDCIVLKWLRFNLNRHNYVGCIYHITNPFSFIKLIP